MEEFNLDNNFDINNQFIMEDEPINSDESLEITYALYKITDDTLFYIYGEDPISYINCGMYSDNSSNPSEEEFTRIDIKDNPNFPSEILNENIKIIHFSFNFIQRIDNLPSYIEELYFDNNEIEFSCYSQFNNPIDNLPNGIKKITFGKSFNQPIDHLPETIEYLCFEGDFNQPIDKLPSGVKEISFQCNMCLDNISMFNQPIDNLPKGLVKLYLKLYRFNYRIDNLPKNLKELHISSGTFNNPLDNLPENLEVLFIHCDEFSHNLDHLPYNLKKLHINSNIKHPLDNLPPNLEIFDLSDVNFKFPLDNLPNSVRKICIKKCNYPFKKLPTNIEEFTISMPYDYEITNEEPIPNTYCDNGKREFVKKSGVNFYLYNYNKCIDNLPEGITYINLGNVFNQEIKKMPSTLTFIRFGTNFNQGIQNFSRNLRVIILSRYFNQPITDEDVNSILPPQLEAIYLGSNFNQPIGILPKSIKIILFGSCFDQSIDDLPEGIKIICFGLSICNITDKLINVFSGINFGNKTKSISKLPSSLEKIYTSHSNKQIFQNYQHLCDKNFSHINFFDLVGLPENI